MVADYMQGNLMSSYPKPRIFLILAKLLFIQNFNKWLFVMLNWERHPGPWQPSQPPGLGVAMVWTPNPSIPGPDLSPGED